MQPYPGTRMAADPRVKLVEENMAKWDWYRAEHDLIDEKGKVVYSRDDIEKAYRLFGDIDGAATR